jgi:hypothetical protein
LLAPPAGQRCTWAEWKTALRNVGAQCVLLTHLGADVRERVPQRLKEAPPGSSPRRPPWRRHGRWPAGLARWPAKSRRRCLPRGVRSRCPVTSRCRGRSAPALGPPPHPAPPIPQILLRGRCGAISTCSLSWCKGRPTTLGTGAVGAPVLLVMVEPWHRDLPDRLSSMLPSAAAWRREFSSRHLLRGSPSGMAQEPRDSKPSRSAPHHGARRSASRSQRYRPRESQTRR